MSFLSRFVGPMQIDKERLFIYDQKWSQMLLFGIEGLLMMVGHLDLEA